MHMQMRSMQFIVNMSGILTPNAVVVFWIIDMQLGLSHRVDNNTE
jgi:hypothetical protein